jgi:hypothetical protein
MMHVLEVGSKKDNFTKALFFYTTADASYADPFNGHNIKTKIAIDIDRKESINVANISSDA